MKVSVHLLSLGLFDGFVWKAKRGEKPADNMDR